MIKLGWPILILLGIILLGIGFWLGKRTRVTLIPNILQSPQLTIETKSEGINVKRVIDGDTIELENGEKIRYIGIDTPETLDPRKPIQCFGKEAAQKNRELVEGKPVWLTKDITDKDKYGRSLRYVYLGDPDQESSVFVNLELVKQGFAHSYSYPPDVKFQDLFVVAQAKAREKNLGLWSSCLAERDPVPQDPTSSPVRLDAEVSGDCFIKGNISASGEKIYHLPGCGSYDKTAIDDSRGERWFCAESEAISAGWRKAKNC
ncbi:thermonuclease family protein [Candidatus Collierbacteria bacterium]|nr:thermonuclease family protein [Candidatus Collierbacteria bacterium]